jgi:hypothetical protein
MAGRDEIKHESDPPAGDRRARSTEVSSLAAMTVDQLLDCLARVLADEAKRKAT